LADLFDVKIPAISKHLKNIFESVGLDEKVVVSILEHTTSYVDDAIAFPPIRLIKKSEIRQKRAKM
jgi:hypothetical protein